MVKSPRETERERRNEDTVADRHAPRGQQRSARKSRSGRRGRVHADRLVLRAIHGWLDGRSWPSRARHQRQSNRRSLVFRIAKSKATLDNLFGEFGDDVFPEHCGLVVQSNSDQLSDILRDSDARDGTANHLVGLGLP